MEKKTWNLNWMAVVVQQCHSMGFGVVFLWIYCKNLCKSSH